MTSFKIQFYLQSAEFDPRIVGLTGPVTAVRQMAQEYRVYFKKVEEEGDDYLVESSHNMYVLNTDTNRSSFPRALLLFIVFDSAYI